MGILLEIIGRLNLFGMVILAMAGLLVLYFILLKQVNMLMFLVVLSAAFVGSAIPQVDDAAKFLRWSSILALFIAGLFVGRITVSPGLILLWGYVFLGCSFLLRMISPSWQLQKSILLIILVFGIPTAFGRSTFEHYKRALILIAIATSIYSILGFLPLASSLVSATRYSGISMGAPLFAATIGALLPFVFWATWKAESRLIKIACGFGFLFGASTLILGGQRAGLIIGFLGVLPLLLIVVQGRRDAVIGLILFVILVSLLSFLFFSQASAERRSFLASRYSIEYGLSGRFPIWQDAFSELIKAPFLGYGIGAVEIISEHSFHNAYLEIWYNSGFLGLVLFAGSQIYFLYRTIYLYRNTNDAGFKSVLALAFGYLIGFVALCAVENKGAGASNIWMILYLFLGVLVSHDSLQSSDAAHQVTISTTSIPALYSQ